MGSRDRANPHDRRAARGWFLTRRTRRARRKTGRASVAGLDMSAPIPPTATRSFGARTRADGDPFGGMAGGTAASRLSASKLLLQGFCFKAPASRLPLRGFLLRGSLRDLRVLRVRKEPALPVRGDWVHPPEILKRLVSHEAHGERAASWGGILHRWKCRGQDRRAPPLSRPTSGTASEGGRRARTTGGAPFRRRLRREFRALRENLLTAGTDRPSVLKPAARAEPIPDRRRGASG